MKLGRRKRWAGACTFALVLALTVVGARSQPADAAASNFQLPWPAGVTHSPGISRNGCSYNCGGHVGMDWYAIDFNLSLDSEVSAVLGGIAHPGSYLCTSDGGAHYYTSYIVGSTTGAG